MAFDLWTLKVARRELRRSGAESLFFLGILIAAVGFWAFAELFSINQDFAGACLIGLGALGIDLELHAKHQIEDFRRWLRFRATERGNSRSGNSQI